jgi:hypothetical protein
VADWRFPRLVALVAAAAMVVPHAAPSASPVQAFEYQVKAAFLLNFAKFIEFPPAAFDGPAAPISICVLGENPFGDTLAQTIANERASGRPLHSRIISSPEEARDCHFVFVPRGQTFQAEAVIAASRARGIAIGESDTFLQRGGTINLFVEEGRVRFALRPEEAERRGIRFSSHLLRLARNLPEHPGVGR